MIAHSRRAQLGWLIGMLLAGAVLAGWAGRTAVGAQPAPARALAPALSCDTLTFAPPVTYSTAIRPRSATDSDFNHDNKLDLVVTNYSANAISFLRGNGDGTFQPTVTYTVGVHPVDVVVGDFNEDTHPDLAVANYDSSNMSYLRGNGDGTFQSMVNFPTGIGAYGIAAGDFNHDTHLDVAVSNVNFGVVNVLLGNGNGTFQAPVQYPSGTRPQSIAVGDFNEDTHPDLVVPNYNVNTISLLLGTGSGTFGAPITTTVEPGPAYAAVGDFNHDSHLDIAAPHYGSGDISILLGNGNGTFQPEVTYSTGGLNPLFLTLGDFNGDGAVDLAVPNYGSNTAAILPGNGDGTFQAALTFATGSGTSPVAVIPGDFNGDTRLDMFTANENTDNASVFLNTCVLLTATPTPALPSPTPTTTPGAPTATPPPASSPTSAPPPPTATATACTITFTDVDQNNPFYAFIRCLACRQIVSGYSDGTFRWGNQVTRGQVSKMVANAAALTDAIPSTQQTFADVAAANPFWLWIERLAAHGYLSGYTCGGPGEPCVPPDNRPYFRPNADITRGQLAKVVALAAQYPDPVPTTQQTFADVPPANPFWLFVERVAAHGVIAGYTCGGPGEPCDPARRPYYRWGANATRGQTAKIVAQALFPNCTTP